MSDLFDEINEHLNHPIDPNEGILLNTAETERIITSLAISRGAKGFTEDEAVAAIRWAESIRVGETMLALLLDGSCDINMREDGEITMGITKQGREEIHG